MTTRLFDDDADQEAFGHWGGEYKRIIDSIKDQQSYQFDINAKHMRARNSDGVPHLNAAACKMLGEFWHKSSRWNGVDVHDMELTAARLEDFFRTWRDGQPKKYVCSSIKSLCLDNNRRIGLGVPSGGNGCIGSNKMVALSWFLSGNKYLRVLSLYCVNLDLEGVQNLAASLSAQSCLKSLNVASNFMGDEAVLTLTKAVKKVKTLENMWLSQNKITQYASIAPLFDEKDGLQNIKLLSLSYNFIGDDFLREMGPALCNHAVIEQVWMEEGSVKHTFTEGAVANFLFEVMLCASGNINDAIYANHSFKEIEFVDDFLGDDIESVAAKNMMILNKLQKISPTEKARQKIIEDYFAANPLKQKVLDIDIRLMPYVLSIIARKTPQTPLTTRKSPTVTDGHRHDILYNVLKNWNMPSLFYHPSPDRLRIQMLEKENEQLKEEIGLLKRKLGDCDELDNENKRPREEFQSIN